MGKGKGWDERDGTGKGWEESDGKRAMGRERWDEANALLPERKLLHECPARMGLLTDFLPHDEHMFRSAHPVILACHPSPLLLLFLGEPAEVRKCSGGCSCLLKVLSPTSSIGVIVTPAHGTFKRFRVLNSSRQVCINMLSKLIIK